MFTRDQALEEGATADQVRRLLESRTWKRVLGRGVAHRSLESRVASRAWAATLTVPCGVVVRSTAAQLHGLPVPDDGLVHLSVPRTLARTRGGIARHVRHPELVAIELNGLPVTGFTQTAIDCLAHTALPDAERLLAWLQSRDRLAAKDLTAALVERAGRHGTEQLRRLAELAAAGAGNPAEALLHQLLREAGIRGWQAPGKIVLNGRVVAMVDVLFAAKRLVIELDGFSAHTRWRAFQDDRSRQNRLVNAGYRVLRFTWNDLIERPAEVIAQILEALGA